MVALFLESLVLMGGAYLLGAGLACLVRRSLPRRVRARPPERRVDPLPEIAQSTAAPARFARARPAERVPAAPAPPAQALAPVPSPPADDLTRISGIDARLEASLRGLLVSRYEQIAAFTAEDVRRIGQELGVRERIGRENWIEQAQILARGGETYFAKRRARGETANAAPTPDEGEPQVPRPAEVDGASRSGDARPPPPPEAPQDRAAAAASPAPALPPAVPLRPAPGAAQDHLQRIGGIDAVIEALLIEQGVSRYSDIAQWSPAEVARFDRQLGGTGRIARENWIEQAQILSRGGDTAFSRAFDRRAQAPAPASGLSIAPAAGARPAAAAPAEEARPASAQLSALRSVRSEAYAHPEPGPAAAQRATAQLKVIPGAALDDLKRIRGIGVLIEKKLNSMGVRSYEQIANWTAEDIDRISQSLDFKGRIERENWVEQARILASGGATEFARRVDRGEVETSRPRG